MRNIALALCLVVLAAPVGASRIGIYDSPAATSCGMVASPQMLSLYIIETQSTGSNAASFRVVPNLPSNFVAVGWTWLGGICVGDCNPYEGAFVGRTCSTDDWVMYRLDYLIVTLIRLAGCVTLDVVGFPGSDVLVYDCGDNAHAVAGGSFSFMDEPGDCEDCTGPVPTHASTWGGIKALYR